MARWPHAVELALTDEEIEGLGAIARSRSEPARRVERARMLFAYPWSEGGGSSPLRSGQPATGGTRCSMEGGSLRAVARAG
jgi:hypothetical protein